MPENTKKYYACPSEVYRDEKASLYPTKNK